MRVQMAQGVYENLHILQCDAFDLIHFISLEDHHVSLPSNPS